jgi:hypothetical protein
MAISGRLVTMVTRFGAEAAGGEVTGLERYEVVFSEAWRAQP